MRLPRRPPRLARGLGDARTTRSRVDARAVPLRRFREFAPVARAQTSSRARTTPASSRASSSTTFDARSVDQSARSSRGRRRLTKSADRGIDDSARRRRVRDGAETANVVREDENIYNRERHRSSGIRARWVRAREGRWRSKKRWTGSAERGSRRARLTHRATEGDGADV